MDKLSKEDLGILNSKIGLKHLLEDKNVNIGKALSDARTEIRSREVKAELVKMQLWMIENNKKMVALFHGGDSSEKSTIIRRLLSHNNARHYRIEVNLPQDSHELEDQWYFAKFIEKLPQRGEMVFWDRSWYNRALIEPVLGLCSEVEYRHFMERVNLVDKLMVESGIYLIKFYFSISQQEQKKRYQELKKDPRTKWMNAHWDKDALKLWDKYQEYKRIMFEKTSTDYAPWIEISEQNREEEIIKAAEHILNRIPYTG